VSAEHTPGPWLMDTDTRDSFMVYPENDESGETVVCRGIKRAADAVAIRAMPDLLAALQGAFDLMSAMRAVASDRINIDEDPRWLNVRAAIAKATGSVA
jgi:hypothetical protein